MTHVDDNSLRVSHGMRNPTASRADIIEAGVGNRGVVRSLTDGRAPLAVAEQPLHHRLYRKRAALARIRTNPGPIRASHYPKRGRAGRTAGGAPYCVSILGKQQHPRDESAAGEVAQPLLDTSHHALLYCTYSTVHILGTRYCRNVKYTKCTLWGALL